MGRNAPQGAGPAKTAEREGAGPLRAAAARRSGPVRPLAAVEVLEAHDVLELGGRDLEHVRVLERLDGVDFAGPVTPGVSFADLGHREPVLTGALRQEEPAPQDVARLVLLAVV